MNYIPTPDKVKLYEEYLARKNEKPLFGCTLGMFIKEHCPRTTAALPDRQLEPDDIKVDLFIQDCEELYQGYVEMDDDFPFAAAPFTYIPWMEAIVGCPIMCKNNSVWAEPCITDWSKWTPEEDVENNPWVKKLCELTEALVKHSAGRYPVGLTLMRGPADVISAMRGAQDYVWDMIDEPDLMREVADKLADIYIKVANAQFARMPSPDAGGYMCGDAGMRIWQPQRFVWLQEDAMALLSPTIYQNVVYPADSKIIGEFGHGAFHLHATALWAIDELLKIKGLDVIELNLESARSDLDGVFAGWKKIRDHMPLTIWAQYDEDTFEDWMGKFLKEIPWEGVNFQIALYPQDASVGKKVRSIYERILGATEKPKA